MPIPKPNNPHYKSLFRNYVCCLCFEELEENTIFIDDEGVKWDYCKNCDKKQEKMSRDMFFLFKGKLDCFQMRLEELEKKINEP